MPWKAYYSGSAGEPESENATVFLAKRGVMVPGVPCVDKGNWGRKLALCESRVLRRIFSVRIAPFTLMSYTKMSIVFGRGWSTNYSA